MAKRSLRLTSFWQTANRKQLCAEKSIKMFGVLSGLFGAAHGRNTQPRNVQVATRLSWKNTTRMFALARKMDVTDLKTFKFLHYSLQSFLSLHWVYSTNNLQFGITGSRLNAVVRNIGYHLDTSLMICHCCDQPWNEIIKNKVSEKNNI